MAPEVVWDGKQLSIHAENSTLSSILAAVQAQTGASIDIPSGAAAERVVVQLGPAPIRDVLTSLLYGTSYDYIIQASDTNKDSISSVIITAHSKGDDVVASAGPAGSSSGPGVHRMPGYSASGKPNFVAQYEAQADQSGGAEPAAEPVTPSPESGSASASSASAAQSPAGKEDAQRAASSSSSDSNSPAGNDVPPASASASPSSASAASDASGNPPSGMDQMVQDLQHLYQQRRQIQAQQNQTQQNQNQPPPAN